MLAPRTEYLVQELDDDKIHAAHPEWKRYLDVLRRLHRVRFTREEFEQAWASLRLDRRKTLDVDTALEVLYRYGIIGFTKIGGGGYGGSAVACSPPGREHQFRSGRRHRSRCILD